MARQEPACWRCGAQWVSEDALGAEARLQVDRWTTDGGSVAAEAAAPLAAATAG